VEDDDEWQHIEPATVMCADLDNLPFGRRVGIDPFGLGD
jgi:hypothetical protein